jgi:hypothetical protein
MPLWITTVAAFIAAVVSICNVVLTYSLIRRSERIKWLREALPDVILGLDEAAHEYRLAIETIQLCQGPERNDLDSIGRPEFNRAVTAQLVPAL